MEPTSAVCAVCHQTLLPAYYFCPNCGTAVQAPPLSTSAATQAGIYLHSIVLPLILFLSISKWQGYKYFKSKDEKVRQVGIAAVILIVLSTLVNYYLAYVWTTQAIQSSFDSINSINAGLGI